MWTARVLPHMRVHLSEVRERQAVLLILGRIHKQKRNGFDITMLLVVQWLHRREPVKYAAADTQILTTKGQILEVAVFGVSAFVSAAFLCL